MPPPNEEDQAEIVSKLAHTLWGTPFECDSLRQLSGGSVNFLFRGELQKPLSRACHGEEMQVHSVVVKHSKEYLSCNKAFLLEPSRWDHEVQMLEALEKFAPPMGRIAVKTPISFLSDADTRIQVMEDIEGSVDLRSKLTSQIPSIFQAPYISSLGFAVGDWLWKFHDWMCEPEQEHLRQDVRQNRAMRELKGKVTYGVLISALEHFPEILEPYRKVLQLAMEDAARDFQKPLHDDPNWGIIHGDLWAGNIVLSPNHDKHEPSPTLYIIDWEMVQYGHRAFDLGQMIGDLLEARFFKNSNCATWAMEGFMRGYGPINDELAFRTAIHAGAHLIAWSTRRAPDGSLSVPMERATSLMRLAVNFIVKARRRERQWFLTSPIACLFSRG